MLVRPTGHIRQILSWNQGHREFPSRNWKIPPAQYQNSPKFPFLKYSKTSHKRTFRSVNSYSFAGFSRTACCT